MTNEEAIKMLKSKIDGHTDTSYEWCECVRIAIKALEQQKVGRWIDIQSCWSDLTRFRCTCDQCGDFNNKITQYCPNCGAKMVESQERGDKE